MREWFGSWGIDAADILGVREAEYFTKTLERRRFAWNENFAGRRVAVPAAGENRFFLQETASRR
ncbi:hypothetical protein DSTSK_41060 [Desulforhabdus sp. TSK]|nr:hypothetical protein DSTSK_41060 [Desulforhabdus sp. TSK]